MSRLPAMPRLGGSLPFAGSAGAGDMFKSLGGTAQEAMAALGTHYAKGYDSARGFNEALYGLADKGYGELAAYQTSAADAIGAGFTELGGRLAADQAGIAAGYGQLQGDVLRGIEGVGVARGREIDDAFERSNANAQQSMINRGLGNTTVLDSAVRGVVGDRERERTRLAEDLAQMRAGYQSQLGQAGLSFRERAVGDQTALGTAGLGFGERSMGQGMNLGYRHLDFLNSIQAAYPDAGMYASLAQQFGAAEQAGQDRELIRQQIAQQAATAERAAGGGGMNIDTPSFGGGYARGVGGLEAPKANYGGSAGFSAGGGGGFMGGYGAGGYSTGGMVSAPTLVGAGGGMARGFAADPGIMAGELKPYTGPLEEGVYPSYDKPGGAGAGEYRGAGGYDDYAGGLTGWADWGGASLAAADYGKEFYYV